MKNIIQTGITLVIIFIDTINGFKVCAQRPGDYFKIKVVDEETSRGVPLVELKTTNGILYYTDNNGIIAFNEPGLMEQEVFFHIKSHGYEYPSDGFGFRGTSLFVSKGDSALVRIKRNNIAERLYRITGQGLYHNSILTGDPVPIKQPLLNSKVMGQDTFIETLYQGKLYWFWGDTDRPSYPLGNFSTSGATSELPWKGGLDPGKGIELTYFVDSTGFSKPMCPISGPGPVWIHWLASIRNEDSTEHMVASYTRIKTLDEAYERGIAIFDDSAEIFKPITKFNLETPLFPDGHALRVTVDEKEYLYFSFSTPYSIRVCADLEHITNPEAYEAYTCLAEGTQYDKNTVRLERMTDGSLSYSWKDNTEPLNYEQEIELIEAGKIKSEEAWLHLTDIEGGTTVRSHAGSVCWNEFRNRWIMIFHERGGTSNLGEVWYMEGDTPTGPWIYARKIVTHDNYSFYNVGQHPIFDQDGGRIIYFEGTYTKSFSDNPFSTPRYDYNQIMYRLNLNDPKLYLPVPVYFITNAEDQSGYHLRESVDSMNIWDKIERIPFFAIPPDRKINGLIAVYQDTDNVRTKLSLRPISNKKPVFYGLPFFETTEEKLPGTWKCKADDFPLQMDIIKNINKIDVSFNDESLFVKNVEYANDILVINVKDLSEETDYIITASVLEGTMSGNVTEIGTGNNFHWEGERIDSAWRLSESKAVVQLFEYKNEYGEYYYSTDSTLQKMIRSEKPICKVWKNPSTTLTLDFKAKPVPVFK